MPLTTVTPGQTILASQHNEAYNLFKGQPGSGEAATLVYNAAGALAFQPSSDPAATTQLVQIKNNAGTVQASIAADGTVDTPALTSFATLTSANAPTAVGGETYRLGRIGINTVGLAPVLYSLATKTAGSSASIPVGLEGQVSVTGGTLDHAIGVLGRANVLSTDVAGQYIGLEGRWDNAIDGASTMKGVLGLGVILSTTAAGITGGYAAETRIEVPVTAAALHIGVGLWSHIEATGSGAVANGLWWNAILGSSATTAPTTAKTTFRSRVQSGDGDLNVTINDNATQNLRAALLQVGTNLMSMQFQIGTNDANSLFSVLNLAGVTALSVDGAGLVNYGIGTTAKGGGAAPTLGTIGGSGPATALQNAWLKVNIGGTNSFIPIWR